MSRGAGFSDACEWRAPAFSAPVDRQAAAKAAGDAVDSYVASRVKMRGEGRPPLSDFGGPPVRSPAEMRADLDAAVPPGSDAPASPSPAPVYWPAGEGRPKGRTAVEDSSVPVGATSAVGSGYRPLSAAAQRAQLDEGNRRSVERQQYTADRLTQNPPRDGLTPDQRRLLDAPLTEYERKTVVEEMTRLETRGSAQVEARIVALGFDPQGTPATIMRAKDRAMRDIEREDSMDRAIAKVKSDRIKPSAGVETGPPDAAPVQSRESGFSEVTTRQATSEEQAAAGVRKRRPKQSPREKALQANRKATRDRTGAPDQRQVVDGELMPPSASKPKAKPYDAAPSKTQIAETRAADAIAAQGDRPLSPKQRQSIADDMFEAEYGQPPKYEIKRDPTKEKPDERDYSAAEKKKMNAILSELTILENKMKGERKTGKYPESTRGWVDSFIDREGREPTRLELEQHAAIRESPTHRRPQ